MGAATSFVPCGGKPTGEETRNGGGHRRTLSDDNVEAVAANARNTEATGDARIVITGASRVTHENNAENEPATTLEHTASWRRQISVHTDVAGRPIPGSAPRIRQLSQDNGLDHTPVGGERDVYKFYCPVCMGYYAEVLRAKCCNNYVCHCCALDFVRGRAGLKPDISAIPLCLPSIPCINCNTVGMQLEYVHPDEEPRMYEDSPDTMKALERHRLGVDAGEDSIGKALEFSDGDEETSLLQGDDDEDDNKEFVDGAHGLTDSLEIDMQQSQSLTLAEVAASPCRPHSPAPTVEVEDLRAPHSPVANPSTPEEELRSASPNPAEDGSPCNNKRPNQSLSGLLPSRGTGIIAG